MFIALCDWVCCYGAKDHCTWQRILVPPHPPNYTTDAFDNEISLIETDMAFQNTHWTQLAQKCRDKRSRIVVVGRFRSTTFRAKIRGGATDFYTSFSSSEKFRVRNLCVCRHCLGYDRKHVTFPHYAFLF